MTEWKRTIAYAEPFAPPESKKERFIDLDKLYELAKAGKSKTEIAKELKFNYPFFMRKLRDSVTAMEVYKRGILEFKQSKDGD